jgi:hypothetical protein
MRSRNSFASFVMACLLTASFLGIASVASTASAWPSVLKPGESARHNNVIGAKYRGRGRPLYLPIVPYAAYDYPYYYRRGYYPRHIGPGYIYYGYPYSYYSRGYYSRYGGSRRLQKVRRY